MLGYLLKKINTSAAPLVVNLMRLFPIYSKSRAGARSCSQSEGFALSGQTE